ncbi:MAG TPA: hypothetical protein VNG33_15410, partial [Polyangiaceae bacterium]|nr:hypothetical protein [Polyangiaceae bacterium]
MRLLALPIAICLMSSYGCAASEESMPPDTTGTTHGGSGSLVPGSSGSSGAGGSGTIVPSGGTGPVATGGTTTTTGTAGTTTTTGTAGTTTTG